MYRKICALFLILLFAGLPNLATEPVLAQTDTVYVVPLQGTVEPGLYRYLERSFREAEQNGASAILLEINTPGGRVDSASDIRDLIFDLPIPVYAYVRYSAISAGSFIALACREFYMAPGSSIGAAELRGATGEPVDEKELSYWERQMRTVAEQQGKDPEVAAAMVRQEIAIDGLVTDKQLLTLTTVEAERIGFTDGVFATGTELLAHLGYQDATVVTVEQTPAESLSRFITNPTVATLLITVGLAALVIEVMTAGFGVAGFISFLSFSLFFGGHIFAGLAGREVIFLFVIGIVLLLVEAVIPNFGVIGLSGLAAIIASVVMSAATTNQGLRMMFMAAFLATLIVLAAFRYLKRTGLWSQLILQFSETVDQGYIGPANLKHLVDKVGVTLTALRPAGTADIEGIRVDVVSEGGYIDQSAKIVVVKVEGTRIVVRPQS